MGWTVYPIRVEDAMNIIHQVGMIEICENMVIRDDDLVSSIDASFFVNRK